MIPSDIKELWHVAGTESDYCVLVKKFSNRDSFGAIMTAQELASVLFEKAL